MGKGAIAGTGAGLAGSATTETTTVGWDFSPGDGQALDAGLVERIGSATSRVVVGSMVITSHTVLRALVDAVDRAVPLRGVYDGGQMDTTGSYNFSANAERNAENQAHLDDPATVAAFAGHLETVIAAYT